MTITLPEGLSVDFEDWIREAHASKVCTHNHGCPCDFCSKARRTVAALEVDFVGTVFGTMRID
jgi:hypothetical protein